MRVPGSSVLPPPGPRRRFRRWNRPAPGSRACRRDSPGWQTASISRSTTNCSLKMGSCTVMLGSSSKRPARRAHLLLAVPVIAVNQLVAMNAVEGEQDHHDEVRNQEREVEAIHLIKALKGLVQKMRAEVVAHAALIERGRHQEHGGTVIQQISWGAVRQPNRRWYNKILPEFGCGPGRRGQFRK